MDIRKRNRGGKEEQIKSEREKEEKKSRLEGGEGYYMRTASKARRGLGREITH